jgi:hypothetical protein
VTKACSVEGCDRPHKGRGYCDAHLKRLRKYGDPLATGRPSYEPICSIEGCSRGRAKREWCDTHYQRWKKHGDPLMRRPGGPPVYMRGDRIGRLTVLELIGGRSGYLCRCDCGSEVVVKTALLRRRATRSCGCLNRELSSQRATTHGMSKTSIYTIWLQMLCRCERPESAAYSLYGGRGIRVCERWHSFEQFHSDMGDRPKDRTLDRIDPDGNYEPSNCRWATAHQQAQNRRWGLSLTDVRELRCERAILGTTYAALARRYGVSPATVAAADQRRTWSNIP